MNKKHAQERVWQFIRAFRNNVVATCADKIDFIIIYGSAVRKEFVPNKSDVDIIIQIYNKEDKAFIEKTATDIFWRITNQYKDLGFHESLSTSSKEEKILEKTLQTLEAASFLYVPVFVLVKGDIDWKKGNIKSDNPLINIGKHLLIPQRSVFLKFKQEGEVLYGRDIRQEIDITITKLDRLRISLAPLFLSKFGILLSPISTKKSVSYTTKALLYHIDGLLGTIDQYKKMNRDEKIEKNKKILLEEFTMSLSALFHIQLDHTKGSLTTKDILSFKKAINIKWGEIHLSKWQTILFSIKAHWFIVRSTFRAILYIIIKQ